MPPKYVNPKEELLNEFRQANLDSYRRNSDVVEYVKILPTQDSCEACKNIGKIRFKLDEVPKLPYEHCTHEMGCRCAYIPVVKGLPEIDT